MKKIIDALLKNQDFLESLDNAIMDCLLDLQQEEIDKFLFCDNAKNYYQALKVIPKGTSLEFINSRLLAHYLIEDKIIEKIKEI